jgi:hypothetical protein
MRANIIRKILVALVIIIPAFTDSGCRKQAKCGCGKDVLFSLTDQSAYVYWTTSTSITFMIVGDPYSTYSLCNPSEMYPNLKDAKTGDILLVSGHVYWDCTYVMQSSNSSYQSLYKVYNCQVTDLRLDLFGKNKPGTPADISSPAVRN